MKIGFIGLGLMGYPMAENVLNKIHPEKFILYNRTKNKSLDFKSNHVGDIQIASSPQEAADLSDVLILMLTDDSANTSVMNEILKSISRSLTIINMSTITQGKSIELCSLAIKKGFKYLAAPVSGTIGPAKQGTLKIYSGGSKEVSNEVQPILHAMGDQTFHIGEIGKEAIVKLLINSNLAVYMSILSETLLAAEALGINKDKFLDIINSGSLATVASKGKGPNVVKGNYTTTFPFEHMLKDVSYSLAMLDTKKMPLISLIKKQYESGLNQEKGKDFSAIFEYYESLYK